MRNDRVNDSHESPGISFWCHNVQKSSVSYAALLAQWGDDGPDIVCIQEPPWIQVGTQHSLTSGFEKDLPFSFANE